MATKTISRTSRLITRCYSKIPSSGTLWRPGNVVVSPYRDVIIPNTTVTEHVWQNLEKWADKTAVVCGVMNRHYTYHQLHKYSLNLAANLRKKLKVKDGDAVCVMMANSPEYTIAALGILGSGADLTTINPIYTAYEAQRQLILSDSKVIVGSPETIPVIKEALKLAKKEIPIISVHDNSVPEATISFKELIEDGDHSVLKEVRRRAEDVAILPYSSGTTGLPKGVEITHRNIVVNCLQQDVDESKHYEDTTDSHQDSILAVLPFYHIYGLSVVMLHKLSVGAKLVTLPKFQPNTFISALKDHKVSLLFAAPPMVLFLATHPDVKSEHLDSIKKIMCGAAPLHEQDVIRTLQKTRNGTEIFQVYGLTETSPLVSSGTGRTDYKCAGYAVSNTEFKIVDENLKALGPNEIGELLIRGPQVMKGYRNNPEATKQSITEDGWFRSGDLASLHDNGTVKIEDRLKELIKVKGYQVPPAELENVLKEHPSVIDAAVVGVPDRRTGEAPRAFVVLREGHKADANDIQEFVKKRVAEYKRVKEVVIMDSLPKNPSGKLLRRVLKEKYC